MKNSNYIQFKQLFDLKDHFCSNWQISDAAETLTLPCTSRTSLMIFSILPVKGPHMQAKMQTASTQGVVLGLNPSPPVQVDKTLWFLASTSDNTLECKL